MKKLLLFCLGLSSLAQAQTTETINYSGSIQTWTVPACVTTITIQALGAQGGYNTSSATQSGLGASMTGTFTVTPGQQIKLLVGQQPGNGTSGNGGGGGTFVVDISNNPLIVAGGGGGSSQTTDSPGKHGQVTTLGGTGAAGGGTGGDLGNGGSIGSSGFQSGAGGGFLSNGADGWTSGTGGFSFLNGGAGGPANSPASGGFGGGGSGSSYVVGGGGGGYSGGGSGGNSTAGVGGGGGSYNTGTNQTNISGVNSGNGIIYISYDLLSSAPATPGSISGMSNTCESETNLTYSVTNDPAASSYTWTVPGGFTIVSGQGTNTIVVDAGTSSGDITVTANNACASSLPATLNVAINSPSASTDVQTACESYTWIDGNTYTASNNSATYTAQTVAGCDSVITLNLTITNATSSTTPISTCASYTWTNGITYTTSGNYMQTLINAVGCDSVATLELTILEPSTSLEQVTNCDSYTWSNGTTYTVSGMYTNLLTNAVGCDSTATLDLTIIASPVASAVDNGDGTLTAIGGNTIQWIDCGTNNPIAGETNGTFAPTQNGTYAAVITESGCSDTSSCVLIDYLATGLNAIDLISVFPNPTNGEVTIKFDLPSAELIIRDAQGKLVKTMNITSGNTVDLNGLERGVYLFEFSTNNGSKVLSIVKQ